MRERDWFAAFRQRDSQASSPSITSSSHRSGVATCDACDNSEDTNKSASHLQGYPGAAASDRIFPPNAMPHGLHDGLDFGVTEKLPEAQPCSTRHTRHTVIDRWAYDDGTDAVLAPLRPTKYGWFPEDWRAFFDERASILEFVEGIPRTQAEVRAFDCCVAEWLNSNPVRSAPGHCLSCGDGEHARDPLLPYGTETSGHTWLHSRCWPTWHEARKAEAIAALKEIGITAPAPLTQQ